MASSGQPKGQRKTDPRLLGLWKAYLSIGGGIQAMVGSDEGQNRSSHGLGSSMDEIVKGHVKLAEALSLSMPSSWENALRSPRRPALLSSSN